MASIRRCDGCQRPLDDKTNPLVAKLFVAPVKKGESKQTHSAYTRHADVGACCLPKVSGVVKWQERKKVPRRRKAA